MIQDTSFAVWNHYGVTGQPTALLVSPTGEKIHEFGGQFSAAEILARL